MTGLRLSGASAIALASLLLGCAPNVGGGPGSGSGTGGATGAGGATGTGGATGAGGSPASGGSSGSGGAIATGGTGPIGPPATGGTTGNGGATGTGGATATGGTTGTGGVTAQGGSSGTPGTGGGTAGGPIDLTGRKALLVVDSPGSMSTGETIVMETLEERGMIVTVGASTGPASLAAGMNVVVVSDSAGSGDFVPIFGSVAVPMIVFGNS